MLDFLRPHKKPAHISSTLYLYMQRVDPNYSALFAIRQFFPICTSLNMNAKRKKEVNFHESCHEQAKIFIFCLGSGSQFSVPSYKLTGVKPIALAAGLLTLYME